MKIEVENEDWSESLSLQARVCSYNIILLILYKESSTSLFLNYALYVVSSEDAMSLEHSIAMRSMMQS